MSANKKKNTIQAVGSAVSEHGGYKVGDTIYCHVRGKVHRGAITLIHIEEGADPHFSFMDDASLNHRVALFSDIIQDPTPAHARQIAREIKKNQTADK